MFDTLKSRDVSVRVEFKDGEEFVTPDASSVTYTLFDNDGTELESSVAVSDPAGSSASITILAALNTLPEGAKFGFRTLRVDFQVSGQSLYSEHRYRILPFLNFAATKSSVRSLIGVDASELSDNDIDLVSAFYRVQAEVGASELAVQLSSGALVALNANSAIAHRAAMDVLPSLSLRILQSQESDGSVVSRFTKPDFEKLERTLRHQYSLLIRELNEDTRVDFPLIQVSTDTDLFGG